jgi:hypothetical protein
LALGVLDCRVIVFFSNDPPTLSRIYQFLETSNHGMGNVLRACPPVPQYFTTNNHGMGNVLRRDISLGRGEVGWYFCRLGP